MKRLSLLVAACALSLASSLFGQTHTQSISFDDGSGMGNAGTYGPNDSFGVDLYLTFSGYNSTGFSLWLETTASAAPFISLTAFTYGTTFPDPNQLFAGPLGFTVDQDTDFYTTPNPSDLGSTQNPPYVQTQVAPGTYFVGHLTVSLSGLAPGVYVLQTDASLGPFVDHRSIVTSYFPGTPDPFRDEPIPNSEYTITVIPEPGTFGLITLGLTSLALTGLRKQRKG